MSILFLGPLPPPVHGFSAINAAMLARLEQAGPVTVFNRALPAQATGARATRKAGRALGHWLGLLGGFIAAASRRPTSVYAGFSGGKGQLLDLPFFVVARLLGIPTYVHHHSFAYLNQPSRLTGACMKVLSRARHIALCPEMAKAIGATYGIPQAQLIVLSNAAFLPAMSPPETTPEYHPARQAIKVGFLSNITAEKGIFEFFAVLRRAAEAGLAHEAEIAGPVDPGILDRFQAELAALPQARHLGPLYGADKQRFFQRIDLLLFPTRYANEAEPVTLHEALQAGATVVAAHRGCIGGMLPDHCGSAQPAEAFESQAIQTLQELTSLDPARRLAKRAAIQQHYQTTAERSERTLRQLVQDISHPSTSSP
ncbi:glycosyltransferase involved in cell wall biosynthesis [Sphaerotilus hippei]|uniref:Glycosyltransferase involved in cell wall biosynthesis n=1 Tax=Sphaerotilus hippei TaxID=744406 RepID=A0A318H3A4_9BURK|nr:glycosyltransferase family 4 protein [Sphaerotilus hippei]PXW93240.1 glycosyltransferase involved in cell wall biosynthesis [Sphaerotilus hippei]